MGRLLMSASNWENALCRVRNAFSRMQFNTIAARQRRFKVEVLTGLTCCKPKLKRDFSESMPGTAEIRPTTVHSLSVCPSVRQARHAYLICLLVIKLQNYKQGSGFCWRCCPDRPVKWQRRHPPISPSPAVPLHIFLSTASKK